MPDLGPEGHVHHTDRDSIFQQKICQRLQEEGERGETAGTEPHSQGRSPNSSNSTVTAGTGAQDTQVLAAGPESIGQGRASSHIHNWCEKRKCLVTG